MAMEISSNYGNYYNSAVYNTAENGKTERTKSEKAQSSKDKVQEYYEKLCKKFPEITFNKSGGMVSGNENKVVINLSNECLKKMASDPEFAKKVEFNLTGAVPGQNWLYAKAKADGAVIHGVTVVMDSDGNVSVTCGGMTRTSGSNQNSGLLNTDRKKERLEKRRKEKEEMEARMEEKRRKNAGFKERLKERRLERG